jgi:predicted acylesterase/phospholipase RssA
MIVPSDIKYLVFSGGGINGYAHIGCWRCLEEVWQAHGLRLSRCVQGAAGASVGSIIALAVILGYSSHELESFAVEALSTIKEETIDFSRLFDGKSTGLMSWKLIAEFVKGLLLLKTGNADMSFGELKEHSACTFVCTGHNITTLSSEYFGTHHTPDMPVWKGVTISCLHPGLFDSMIHDDCEYYDGGLSNSVPFEVFPLEHTLVSVLTRTPGGAVDSMMSRFIRVLEAFDTATKNKVDENEEKLAAVIRIFIDVGTSEHIMSTGTLNVKDIQRSKLISLGKVSALRALNHDLWTIVHALQLLLKED